MALHPFFIELAARRAGSARRIAQLAATPGPMVFADRDGGTAHVVCKDPGDPDQWRTTRFDARGAAGHAVRSSFADALKAAREHGADLATGTAVDAASIDAVVTNMNIVVRVDEDSLFNEPIPVGVYLDRFSIP
jgi:hypothetical protein